MIAFLIKVRVKTIFSVIAPIIVEPLELCCLKTVLDSLLVENYLIDHLFGLKAPKDIVPDVIILNGYNVAEGEMLRQAGCYKAAYPHSKVIVGGVHVQGNPQVFHVGPIDYVFHTQSLDSFRRFIQGIEADLEGNSLIEGVDTAIGDKKTGKTQWQTGAKKTVEEGENILADRSFFQKMSDRTHYLEKRKVAIIKGSTGCPFTCSYCYCKEMNQGRYVRADFGKMAAEMENIDADYFWIVDDVLFSKRSEALDFIENVKKSKIKGKFIVYLRADFILREKDLMAELKEIGLAEVIVGFEATNNKELEGYGKTTDALDYPAVIRLLKETGIDLTPLFMVKPGYGGREFKELKKFISDNGLQVFTLSILTPMKGTKEYELAKDQLTTQDPEKFDFLHQVVKSKLPKVMFYTLFYGIQLRLIGSKRIWKYILGK